MKNIRFFTLIFLFLSIYNFVYSQNSGLAVVLVDMQEEFVKRSTAEQSKEYQELVQHQMKLLEWAIASNIPIIIYEYNNMGATDYRLMNIVKDHEYIQLFKFSDNAFNSITTFVDTFDYLRKWDVDTIIIAGVNGGACIAATVSGAIRNNLNVISSKDIVADFNTSPFTYPDDNWHKLVYEDSSKFKMFSSLEEIIH